MSQVIQVNTIQNIILGNRFRRNFSAISTDRLWNYVPSHCQCHSWGYNFQV